MPAVSAAASPFPFIGLLYTPPNPKLQPASAFCFSRRAWFWKSTTPAKGALLCPKHCGLFVHGRPVFRILLAI